MTAVKASHNAGILKPVALKMLPVSERNPATGRRARRAFRRNQPPVA